MLGEREPPPKKVRKRKKQNQEQSSSKMPNYFDDSDEDVPNNDSAAEEIDDCETLSAAIALEVPNIILKLSMCYFNPFSERNLSWKSIAIR